MTKCIELISKIAKAMMIVNMKAMMETVNKNLHW